MTNKKLIFDIGMNIGQDTRQYLNLGFDVIAVEADPELVRKNKKKFKNEIKEGRLVIINYGISDKKGILSFYKNLKTSAWSSFNKESATRNNTPYEVVQVECILAKDLFQKYGIPYYMKVDIEGYDYLCIEALDKEMGLPKYVSSEASSIKILEMLYAKGYKWFKIINQANGFKPMNKNEKNKLFPYYLHIKNGLLLRFQKFFPVKYPYSSTGPFGENTKGNWLTYEEVTFKYYEFYGADEKQRLNNISWFDFHAKLGDESEVIYK